MKDVETKSNGNPVKTIIVPVDFSGYSEKAFYQGVKMAHKFEANIVVVTVFVPVVVPAEGLLYMDPDLQDGVQERFRKFVDELESGMNDEDRASVEIEAQFRVGTEGPQIQNLIRETPGSMVVMSTSGAGNRIKEFLGSVSLWVVKNAECPVLLLPAENEAVDCQKVMYACDHFGTYDTALAAIKYYCGNPQALVDIVHVFQEDTEYVDKGIELLKQEGEQQFKEAIVFDPEFVKSMKAYVKSNKIDLIVMERKDRGFWKELFHISKTRKMAAYSEVPLLVLHDREFKTFATAEKK